MPKSNEGGDALGVSTIGKRRLQSSTSGLLPSSHPAPQQQQQQQEQQAKAVQSLLKRLESDSRFFETNQPYTLPNFAHNEIELQKQLGQGEFGIVYEVSAIHVPDECPCPKCANSPQQQHDDGEQPQPKGVATITTTTSTSTKQTKTEAEAADRSAQHKDTQRAGNTKPSSSNCSTSSGDSLIRRPEDVMIPLGLENTSPEMDDVDIVPPLSPSKPKKTTKKQTARTMASSMKRLSSFNDSPLVEEKAEEEAEQQHHQQQQPKQHVGGGHRRVTSQISFADQIVEIAEGNLPPKTMPDDDSTLSTESDPDDFLSAMNMFDDDTDGEAAFLRGYMSTHVLREGRPRYAVKRLMLPTTNEGDKEVSGNTKNVDSISRYGPQSRPGHSSSSSTSTEERAYLFQAAVDLATEAKFLASIRHPNIVKMRGTVGTPGCYDFMIVMDCLVMTLRDKMALWVEEEKHYRQKEGLGGTLRRILQNHTINRSHRRHHPHKGDALQQDQHGDKLLAVYDIARAMKYLHNQFILFRDLKPENVAFDVRGDMRLFDFGLAKELKQKDLLQAPDKFNATGLTGSRRYMAPEVVQCKNYGLSADVYSYSIVFWEVFSSQKEPAYPKMDLNQHFEQVVLKHKRPNKKRISKLLSKQLELMMVNMWDPNPIERPNFKSICEQLGAECVLMNATNRSVGSGQTQFSDRTSYLMNRSLKSQYGPSASAAIAN